MSVVGIDHSKLSSSSSRGWLTMILIVNITINYGKTRRGREGKEGRCFEKNIMILT